MIPEEKLEYIRTKLKESKRPLFFFDDDADGVSSFVQLYRVIGEGKGICVKGKPILEAKYVRKVQEFSPDLVIVLDKPMIEDEFIQKVNQEIIWLDHHPLQEPRGTKYFNPRQEDLEDNRPTSYWAYLISKDLVKNNLWVAMFGIIGDWNLLLKEEFNKQYPYMLPLSVKTPEDALFSTEIGKLVKVINWNLKGTTSDVNKSVKIITRIDDPYEILEQKTPKGKFLYKKYSQLNIPYEETLSQVKVTRSKFLVFTYSSNKNAFSSELSNELLYKYPSKVIIIGRIVDDEIRLSLRSRDYVIVDKLQKALEVTTTGHGGGHDHACGASMNHDEFEAFLKVFKKQF